MVGAGSGQGETGQDGKTWKGKRAEGSSTRRFSLSQQRRTGCSSHDSFAALRATPRHADCGSARIGRPPRVFVVLLSAGSGGG
jgi:hypothetical protein